MFILVRPFEFKKRLRNWRGMCMTRLNLLGTFLTRQFGVRMSSLACTRQSAFAAPDLDTPQGTYWPRRSWKCYLNEIPIQPILMSRSSPWDLSKVISFEPRVGTHMGLGFMPSPSAGMADSHIYLQFLFRLCLVFGPKLFHHLQSAMKWQPSFLYCILKQHSFL